MVSASIVNEVEVRVGLCVCLCQVLGFLRRSGRLASRGGCFLRIMSVPSSSESGAGNNYFHSHYSGRCPFTSSCSRSADELQIPSLVESGAE